MIRGFLWPLQSNLNALPVLQGPLDPQSHLSLFPNSRSAPAKLICSLSPCPCCHMGHFLALWSSLLHLPHCSLFFLVLDVKLQDLALARRALVSLSYISSPAVHVYRTPDGHRPVLGDAGQAKSSSSLMLGTRSRRASSGSYGPWWKADHLQWK